MSKVIDFDAFRSEQKHEPHQLKIGGRMYELPPSIPVSLALDIARLQETEGGETDVDEDMIRKLGASLFGGKDAFETILRDGGVTIDEMPELVKQILMSYGSGGTAPNRKARRARAKTTSTSSKTGPRSKQTS